MALEWPYIDRIWRAEGAVPLPEGMGADEAFARLDPLFQTSGTSYNVAGESLSYSKHNPAAQDKLATFTRGTLTIAHGVMRFNVTSRALLLCFLAPLLFLFFAQAMVTINGWEKAAETAQGEKAKDEEKGKDKPVRKLNPIDEWLGAPAPEDPAKKKEKEKDKDKEKKDEGKFDPTPSYVLAGLFFLTYLVGRVLEPWLLKRTLRAALAGELPESPEAAAITPPLPGAG
ncbi:MAG: hypothetical protein ACOVNS_11470 [Erythrobacter sp.]|jgi:hypothetical protein